VGRIDRHRETFHRRYWAEKALLPEIFTITLNSAKIDEQRMVDCIVPLIRSSGNPSSSSSSSASSSLETRDGEGRRAGESRSVSFR